MRVSYTQWSSKVTAAATAAASSARTQSKGEDDNKEDEDGYLLLTGVHLLFLLFPGSGGKVSA